MKKVFSFIILMLLSVTFLFTGCGLVQLNTDKYLDRVVASVSKDNETVVTITKRDLLNSYNNNAALYINTYGYTAKQTVKLLLDNLIDRELVILKAKEYTGDISTNNDYIDKYNQAVEDTFDYFDSQILSYEKQLREIKGLEKIDEDEESSESAKTDYDPYNAYEKKVLYFEETNSYELVTYNKETKQYDRTYTYKVVKDEATNSYVRYFYNTQTNAYDIKAETKFANDNVTKKELSSYDYQANNHGNAELTKEAYEMFIKSLIKAEEGKNLSKNENEVLKREFDRVMKTYLGNAYVNTLKEIYTINTGVDNQAILTKYKNKVAESYATYKELDAQDSNSNAGYTKYAEDMNSKASDVYYQPYGEKFVQVAHVLIKFTDEQLNELSQLEDDYKNGIITTYDEYQEKYNVWLNSAGTKARYTYVDLENGVCTEDQVGNEYGEVISYSNIYNEINQALNACGDDVEARAIKFNEFVYKYNMDTGSLNQSYYYVVNLDTNIEDKMVKEFADTSRELIAKGEGSLSEPVFVKSSNYSGYHIIFAVKTVDNLVDINSLQSFGDGEYFDGAIKKLYQTKIMLGTEKTLYDALYDLVATDSYSTYQSNVVKTLKNDSKITYNEKYYKDLY